jgi:hypothetical protein
VHVHDRAWTRSRGLLQGGRAGAVKTPLAQEIWRTYECLMPSPSIHERLMHFDGQLTLAICQWASRSTRQIQRGPPALGFGKENRHVMTCLLLVMSDTSFVFHMQESCN